VVLCGGLHTIAVKQTVAELAPEWGDMPECLPVDDCGTAVVPRRQAQQATDAS